MIRGKGQLYERGEDPKYVKDNCIPVDRNWYYSKQIMQPMERLLIPLFGNVNTRLFFERAQQGGMHSFFKSDREDWIPPLLKDKNDASAKSKKRKAGSQTNTIGSYFRPTKK